MYWNKQGMNLSLCSWQEQLFYIVSSINTFWKCPTCYGFEWNFFSLNKFNLFGLIPVLGRPFWVICSAPQLSFSFLHHITTWCVAGGIPAEVTSKYSFAQINQSFNRNILNRLCGKIDKKLVETFCENDGCCVNSNVPSVVYLMRVESIIVVRNKAWP